jgi:DNA-binding PadR family transcriptional regulator
MMGTERVAARAEGPMRSLVNWALLGLVIERPSYAYELAQRFEREYRDALSLSSVSHIYTALNTLQSRALVEEFPGTRGARQSKPHYRATAKGIDAYREWLVAQIDEDRQRQRLFVLQLGAFMRQPHEALEILTRFQERCTELADPPVARLDAIRGADRGALATTLLEEESRLALGAKLAWAKYARKRFTALLDDPELRQRIAS